MKTLSQKQKIGTLSLVIFGFALVGLISTGKLDMSRLSSNVLNGSTYICTENGQKRNLNDYKQAVRNKEQAEEKIKIMSGEIVVIKNTIEGHKKTIASHGETISKQNVTIGQLFDHISRNCTRPKTPRENALCIQKKQQKTNLEQSNKNLLNQINNLKTLITRLEGQLKQKNENISTWNKKIEQFSKYIKDYDLCNESLKGRLIITSPLMSGEVTMSGEVGKRVELYKFSMTIPAPTKAQINEIRFDTAFGPGSIELDEWYVKENSTATSIIYPCRLENNGQFRCALERMQSSNFDLENGRVQNYSLSAVVKDIKEPGNFKIYGISKEGVLYNETRRDADNQSTPIKINYSNKAISQIGGYTVSCNSIGNNAASGCNTCKRADIDTQTPFSPVALFTSRNNSTNEIISLTGSSIYTKTYQDVVASPTGYIIDRFDLALSASAQSWTWAKMQQGQSISINGVPSNVNLNDPIYGVIFTTTSALKDVPASDISNKTCLFIYAKNDIKCGNGIKEGTEQCDDGNTTNGDGCDNLCKNEPVRTCTDSDGGKDYYTKGLTKGLYFGNSQYTENYDYCVMNNGSSTGVLVENYCGSDNKLYDNDANFTCPNGCSDGACKKEEKAVCTGLTFTPTFVSQGGKIEYTCTGTNARSYLVTVRKAETQEIVGTFSTPTGSFVIPENTLGIYSVDCTINEGDSTCINHVTSIDGRPSVILQDPSTSWQEYFFLYDDNLTPSYLNGYGLLFRMNVPAKMVVTKMVVKVVDEGKFIESIGFTDSKGRYTTKPIVNGKVIFDNLSEMPGESLPTFIPNYTKKSNFGPGSPTTITLESIEYTDGTTSRVLPIEKGRTTKLIGFSPSMRSNTMPAYFKNGEVNLGNFTYANSFWGNPYQILEMPVEFDLNSGHNSTIGNELKLLGNDGEVIPTSTRWLNTGTNKKQAIITLASPYNVTKGVNHVFTLFAQVDNGVVGDKIKINIGYNQKELILVDTTGGSNFTVRGDSFGISSVENTLTYKD